MIARTPTSLALGLYGDLALSSAYWLMSVDAPVALVRLRATVVVGALAVLAAAWLDARADEREAKP